MAEAAAEAPRTEEPVAAAARVRRRPRWWSLLAKTVLSLVAGAMLMLAALGLLLDTDLGHRVLLDRIAAMTPNSGLRIRIGRIEGSIWGKTALRDVRLYDPEGLWAESPKMTLDWRPTSWLWDRLAIDEIGSELAIVHRLPRFDPPRERRSLPAYDMHIGRFELAQLRFEPAVTGVRRTARVSGEAEYRSGRFLLDLDAAMRGGGDRLALLIDSAPDRDQFDVEMSLDAPADGVLVRLLGASVPLRAEVRGEGSWSRWDGRARIALAGRDAGDLRLAARSGRYGAAGWLEAAPLLGPRLAALAAPQLQVQGEGRIADGVLDGRFSAASPAARLAVQGAADLREDAYRDVRAGLLLLRPAPLAPGAAVSAGTRVTAVIDGPFAERSIAYRIAVPRLQMGDTAFEALAASGSGRWAGNRMTLPLAATVGRISGSRGVLLTGARLGGTLLAEGGRISGEAMSLSSDRLRSRFRFEASLLSGRTSLAGDAASDGLALAGLGTVDVAGDWRAASDGGAFSVSGTSRGIIRRFDNKALEWAAGGPLRFETSVAAGAGGALQLSNLRLAAPRLQLGGRAARLADGRFTLEGSGRQASLGPLSLRYGGERLSLRLARPSERLGIRDVRVEVEPAARGFGYRAAGRSPLGPFAARGTVAPNGAALQVAALSVSGAHASGVLRPAGGGVAGRLDLRGALSGPLSFSAGGGAQQVEAELVASDARFGRVPIGSGRIHASVSVGNGGALAGSARFDGAADRLWAMAGAEGSSLSGPLAADVRIAGTASNPAVSGTVQLQSGRFASSAAGSVIDAIDARGRFDGDRLVIEALSGRTGEEGRIEGSGTIGFGGAVDVRVELDRALLFARPELRGRVTGPLRIRSSGEGGSISGALQLTGAEVRLGSASSGGSAGGGASGGGWSLDLGLEAERIGVEGRGLESRWRAALRVGGTARAPAITGEATLIDGTYRVLGAAFALERGTMRFDGSADPQLDIVARPPGGIGAAVRIGGRASRPQIGFAAPTSERSPALPPAHRPDAAAPPARRARRRVRRLTA
ncbi:MAG TPA: translocation/assembly module TamB domain-containing protein [Allosphingosinicella sp.]|jgi:translocation and assembly module TamB